MCAGPFKMEEREDRAFPTGDTFSAPFGIVIGDRKGCVSVENQLRGNGEEKTKKEEGSHSSLVHQEFVLEDLPSCTELADKATLESTASGWKLSEREMAVSVGVVAFAVGFVAGWLSRGKRTPATK